MKGLIVPRWLVRCGLGACCSLGSVLLVTQAVVADPPRASLGTPPEATAVEAAQPLPSRLVWQPPPVSAPVNAPSPAPLVILQTPVLDSVESAEPPTGPAGSKRPSATTIYMREPMPASAPAATPATMQSLPENAPRATLGALVVFPRQQPGPQRRSYVDLTAAPCFAHAPDYRWIVGRLEYSSANKEWRLRYASVDEVDHFGGKVTLVQDQHVDYLVDGTYIQVRGHLVNTDRTGLGTAYYRIEWFQNVQDPNQVLPPPPER